MEVDIIMCSMYVLFFFLKVHFFKDLTQFNFIQLHKITTICISYKRDDKYFKLQYCLS